MQTIIVHNSKQTKDQSNAFKHIIDEILYYKNMHNIMNIMYKETLFKVDITCIALHFR